ncbi:MAG: DUF4430 domain-containing protein, partial [Peptococcaceae bacterium]|nr:DUF4430 domain-containing protein [Peptococcaceae bacterium]
MNRLNRAKTVLLCLAILVTFAAGLWVPTAFLPQADAAVEWTDMSSLLQSPINSLYGSSSGDLYYGVSFRDGTTQGRLYRLSPGETTPVDLGALPHLSGVSGTYITGMCEISGKLYCADNNNAVWVFDLQGNRFEDEPVRRADGAAITGNLWGLDEDCLYLASQGELYLYDKAARAWRNIKPDPEAVGTIWGINSLWGTDAANVYAAGSFLGAGKLLHFDGRRWSKIDTGAAVNLYAVWGTSRDNVFACGENGTVVRFDGSGWTTVTSGLTTKYLAQIKGNGPDVYAFTSYYKEMLHYDGAQWELISDVPQKIQCCEVTENGDVYISYAASKKQYLYKYTRGAVLPDLAVEGVSVSSAVYGGGPAAVTVTVRNKGLAEAPAGFTVDLRSEADGGQPQSVTASVYSAVYAGESREVGFTWTPPPGARFALLRAVADSPNQVAELNEFNNEKTRPVTLSGLTLALSAPEGGSIEAEPARSAYDYLETVRLRAAPADGYLFRSWGGDIRGSGPDNYVVMTSDTSVTAEFIPVVNDLAALQPKVSPSSWDGLYHQGVSYGVSSGLRNNGNVDIRPGEARLVLYAGDEVVASREPERTLKPGEQESVSLRWRPATAGNFVLRVEAQFTGSQVDAAPADNVQTVAVEVEPSVVLEVPYLRNALYREEWSPEGTYPTGGDILYMTGYSPTEMYGGTGHGIIYYEGAGIFKFYQQTLDDTWECPAVWKNAAGELCAIVNEYPTAHMVKYTNHGDYYSWDAVEDSDLGSSYCPVQGVWVSPEGKVYAAGKNDGKVYRYDGAAWSEENLPLPEGSWNPGILSVFGFAENDIYAGGRYGLYHYDGNAWTRIKELYVRDGFMRIYGTAPNDVYIYYTVGTGSAIEHYDGSAWSEIPGPGGYIAALVKSVSGELYAVSEAQLFRYQGGEWRLLYLPGLGGSVSDLYSPLPGVLLVETSCSLDLPYIGSVLTDIDYTPGPVGEPEPRPTVATASIRVEGYSGTILPKTEVTVDAFDLTPYLGPASGGSATPSPGWGPDRLQYPTVAHALVKALTEAGIDCTDHVNGLDLQDYGWSLYVAMIAGEREFDQGTNSGWYYYVDGKLPSFGCQAYTLKGGEDIVWSYVRDYTEVWYSFLTADKTALAAGDSVRLGLQGYRCDMMGAGGTESLFGRLTLYVQKGAGEKTECDEGVSNDDFECPGFDEEGNLIVRFKTPGEYTISADHPPGVDIVRPASLKVTVEAGGTPDTTPPAFAEGYPRAEDVTAAGFTLKLKLAEPGTVYYRVAADGADPGSDYETWAAVSVPGTGEVGQAVGGLSPGTAYDVYVIARDAAGNWQSAPVKLDVATLAESAVRVAGKAADPSVTLAAGNRTVGAGDQSWTIEVTSGTVKEDVSAADLTITGLPAGLSASVARGEGNTIVITVSGTAQQAVGRLTTVSVAVRGVTVTEPGAADSDPVSVFLNPAPVREQQVTVSAEQPDLTLDRASPPATVVVPPDVTDARISLVPLLSEADGAKTAVLPAGLTVQANTSAGQIKVEIPAGTAVSAPPAWTGALNVPAVRPNSSVTVTPDPGKTATVHAVVEVGFDDVPITFDRAVRMVFPGQAGKEVGYYRGGAFTRITTVMTSDTQEAGDALPAGGEGRIDAGQDLIVWTKHFTRFVIYTQTASGGGGSGGGGGGGGSSSAGQAVSSTTGSAVVTPGAGGTVSLGGEVRLEIPAGALRGTSPVEVKIQKVTSPPAVPAGLRTLGNAYQFSVGGATGYNFHKPVTLSLAFDPSVLKPGEKAEVYSCDPSSQKWVSLGGTVSGGAITVTVDHGNIFAVLARTEAKPAKEETTVKLTDIIGHWAQKEIEYMAGKGYVVGVGDNRFAPEATVTRAQFAVIAARLAGLTARP